MPPSRNSILLIGLLSAFSLVTFDLYQPSLPYITEYFATTYSYSQLTLGIYLFFFGITHLIWGPLIDHYGRRRLLPGSLLLALFASLMCAFATNIVVLIIGRSLQGCALCCASLISLSSTRDFEQAQERAKILSYISMIVSISPIFAPVIGSLIFAYLGWQANFIVMAIMALILLLQSQNGLVESPFWTPPQQPFLLKNQINAYRAILSVPILWYGSLIMMFSFTAVMLSVINSSYLIINQLGFSPLSFGIIFILNGLNIILGNYLGIGLRKYLNLVTTIHLGNSLIIVGGLSMLLSIQLHGLSLYALSFALISNLGISVSAPPTMSLTLSGFKENSGIAVGFINTLRLFGSSILSMLVGSLLSDNINTLPLAIMLAGIGACYCSWLFMRAVEPEEPDFEEDKVLAQ